MKIESASEIVHSAEIHEDKYMNPIVMTKCGRRMVLSAFVPEDGWCRKTSKPITCKNCKKKK